MFSMPNVMLSLANIMLSLPNVNLGLLHYESSMTISHPVEPLELPLYVFATGTIDNQDLDKEDKDNQDNQDKEWKTYNKCLLRRIC